MFLIFGVKKHRPMMDADSGADLGGGNAAPPADTGGEGTSATGTGGDNGGATGTEGVAGTASATGSTGTPSQSKQTPEQDAAFADLRRKAEEADKKAKGLERDHGIARKYGAEWGVYSEADIAEKFGASHGIKTLADFEAAVQREEYKKQGIDPNLINQIIENHPDIIKAREREAKEKFSLVESGFEELKKDFPTLVKEAADIDQTTWDLYLAGNGKISLKQAFTASNPDKVLQITSEAAKQKALNDINNKSHLGTEGDGGGSGVDAHIPAETLQMYMDQGMSKADAQKFHKKLYG